MKGRRSIPTRQGSGRWCELLRTDRHDLTECRLVKELAVNWQKNRDERRRDDHDDHGLAGPNRAGLGFQEPRHAVSTIFIGAGAPPSRRRAKLLWREVCAVASALGDAQPLKWSSTPVTFDRGNHPTNTTGVGLLPVVVTPTICNIGVGRT